jgi:electron transport complex protein RnfD
MTGKLTVSFAPHIHDNITTSRIMLDMVIALVAAFIVSNIVFGYRAALVVCVCVASCVFFEWAFEKMLKRDVTVKDLSAVVTGMLLAFNLPATIPLWQAVFGSFVAIIMVKQLFGGLGKNFANPAITARIVMFFAFSIPMTTWIHPSASEAAASADVVTAATALTAMSKGIELPSLRDMFLGFHGGSLGETSELMLLAGGLYLMLRRVITWHAPVALIGTVFVLTAITGNHPEYQLLSGGLFLGAIFMATDYSTTPLTKAGRAIFGVGAGVLTVLIRLYGSFPEGVSFGILVMNCLVPYINKLTLRKPLGASNE